MKQILERLEALEGAVAQLSRQKQAAERQVRLWRRAAALLAVVTLVLLPLGSVTAQSTCCSTLAKQVAAIQALLAGITRSGNDITISGANLHIVSGSGATNGTPNGLGNLIVGYNETQGLAVTRTGSHNIVVGAGHTYSSFGGFVVGYENSVTAPYAAITGGQRNTASGGSSSVSGGSSNTASGANSSVSGGYANLAGGTQASVSGGSSNTASSSQSSVSGGRSNFASGQTSSVSGGIGNTASNTYASVSGGAENAADGNASSVSGGMLRYVGGSSNWAAGGLFQPY